MTEITKKEYLYIVEKLAVDKKGPIAGRSAIAKLLRDNADVLIDLINTNDDVEPIDFFSLVKRASYDQGYRYEISFNQKFRSQINQAIDYKTKHGSNELGYIIYDLAEEGIAEIQYTEAQFKALLEEARSQPDAVIEEVATPMDIGETADEEPLIVLPEDKSLIQRFYDFFSREPAQQGAGGKMKAHAEKEYNKKGPY